MDDREAIAELTARVAKLEAWVKAAMRVLSGMQVEPVLNELEEAQRAATRKKAKGTRPRNRRPESPK